MKKLMTCAAVAMALAGIAVAQLGSNDATVVATLAESLVPVGTGTVPEAKLLDRTPLPDGPHIAHSVTPEDHPSGDDVGFVPIGPTDAPLDCSDRTQPLCAEAWPDPTDFAVAVTAVPSAASSSVLSVTVTNNGPWVGVRPIVEITAPVSISALAAAPCVVNGTGLRCKVDQVIPVGQSVLFTAAVPTPSTPAVVTAVVRGFMPEQQTDLVPANNTATVTIS